MAFYRENKRFTIAIDAKKTKKIKLPGITAGRITVLVRNADSLFAGIPASQVDCKLKCDKLLLASGTNMLSVANRISSDKFSLDIKNKENEARPFEIDITYTSDLELFVKRIPLSFFRQAFDAMWNQVQPIKEVKIDRNVFTLTYDPDFKAAFDLDELRHDFGSITIGIDGIDFDFVLRNLKTTSIEFSVGTGSLPGSSGSAMHPVFTVNVIFDKTAKLIMSPGPNLIMKDYSLRVNFYLDAKEGKLVYQPEAKLYGSVDARVLPNGKIDDFIDSQVKSGIEKFLSDKKFIDKYGPKISRWFLGGEYPVNSVTSEGEEMIVEFAKKNKKEKETSIPRLFSTPGSLSEIDHIVVLMMENRSFDQVLGYLSMRNKNDQQYGETLPDNFETNGLKKDKFDQWANSYKRKKFPPYKLDDRLIKESPNHNYDNVRDQKVGNMKGFVKDFANIRDNVEKPKVVMGYYDDKMLPVYAQLANEFLICDNWYCSIPGGTLPNRFVTLTGYLDTKPDGGVQYNNPDMSTYIPVHTKTLFDHLTDKGVSWKYYEHGYCTLRLFEKYTFDMENIIDVHHPELGFFETARKGKLPSVTFIDPDFIEYPPGNDDHAPSDPMNGQLLVGNVVNALKANKKAWNKTLLIVTYDEHGGFFDHVNPKKDEPAPLISGSLDEYGIRVPTFIISPWVKKGGLSNTIFDHTSIAATIFRRFCSPTPPSMGSRTNKAEDLRDLIEKKIRKDIPDIEIPRFRPQARSKQRLPKPAQTPAQNDFHELMLMASLLGRSPK